MQEGDRISTFSLFLALFLTQRLTP